MPLLFSYGTLQQEEVQLSTFGRLLQGERDELPGFELSLVRIENPQVVAPSGQTHYANVTVNGRNDCRVRGTVFEISDAELAAADRYEAPAAYQRIAATLASGKQAWVYVHTRSAPEASRALSSSLTSQGEAPVEIVQYDPLWPSKFESERRVLQAVLARWLAGPIEHVGSTAIPGMPAKPVIDIMAGVRSLEDSQSAISDVVGAGYVYFPYRPDIMHWFCKPSAAFRTHHLHLVPLGSDRWVECLAFRDAIRRDEGLATEYAALKRRLAQTFKFDREAYTDGKAPFVQRVLNKAGMH